MSNEQNFDVIVIGAGLVGVRDVQSAPSGALSVAVN